MEKVSRGNMDTRTNKITPPPSTKTVFKTLGIASKCEIEDDFTLIEIDTPSIKPVKSLPSLHTTSLQDTIDRSYIFVHEAPPATLPKSNLRIYTGKESDAIKARLGIKPSSHKIDMVSITEGCDLLLAPTLPEASELNNLPGKGDACYILTRDYKIYYIDKKLKTCEQLTCSRNDHDALMSYFCDLEYEIIGDQLLYRELSETQHDQFFKTTAHVHNLGIYKENKLDSPMSQLEAMNSTAYQLLGPRHFPVCFAIYNEEGRFIGVYSKLLPGFIPNSEKHISHDELEINSLDNMIKERNEKEIENIKTILKAVNTLAPLLFRGIDPESNYFSQALQFGKLCVNYGFGGSANAIHAKPTLDAFLKKEPSTIPYGELYALRRLLISRKTNIEKNPDQGYMSMITSLFKSEHKHDEELLILDKTILLLNIILLNDTAFYIKKMRAIDKYLKDNWVDINAEKINPNSPYREFTITDGLIGKITVTLDDIIHYRNQCGLAIGLFARFALKDPDGHANNVAADGRNVDGDLAVYDVTGPLKKPGTKPHLNNFDFNTDDFLRFPYLQVASLRYWPTICTFIDKSANKACSISSASEKLTQNYFTEKDVLVFQSLEDETIFSFQKYVQLIIESLTTREMHTVCAKIHMNDDIHRLEENGLEKIPLKNLQNERQDVQQQWIDCLSNRALEARALAFKLLPLKRMLEYQGDLILEMVLEHFALFKSDCKIEMNALSYGMLDAVIQENMIIDNFEMLKAEILETALGNSHVVFESTLTPLQ